MRLFEVGDGFTNDGEQVAVANQLFSSLNVLPQFAVYFVEFNVFADTVENLLVNRGDALTVVPNGEGGEVILRFFRPELAACRTGRQTHGATQRRHLPG